MHRGPLVPLPLPSQGVEAEGAVPEAQEHAFGGLPEPPLGAWGVRGQGPGHAQLQALAVAQEGVGPGIRHGPDQVEGLPPGAAQVQEAVLGLAAAEIGGGAEGFLGDASGGAVRQGRGQAPHEVRAAAADRRVRLSAVSSQAMGRGGLADDVSVVGLGVMAWRVIPVPASPLTSTQLMGARPR